MSQIFVLKIQEEGNSATQLEIAVNRFPACLKPALQAVLRPIAYLALAPVEY